MTQFEFDDELSTCLVCSSKIVGTYLTDHKGIKISKCAKCEFQFMNPHYSDRYLSEYYANYMGEENFDYWREALAYGHGFYLSIIEKYVSPGKMLDIGCGNGHLLEAAKKRGWLVSGYDVDSKSTAATADRLGIDVKSGDFFSCSFGQDYDLITMHQVLEHVKDPNRYLSQIRTLLKRDGHFFVAVPNIRSLSNRLKRMFEVMGLRRRGVAKYYDSEHHVLYFEPKTLTLLLQKHGFEVLYQRNGHSTRPNQSWIKRAIMRNITESFFAKSTFFVIAKKIN